MISRRDFLKGAGVAALAVAATGVLAGCSDAATNTIPTPTPAPAPDPAPAVQTATLADGVVLTIESTARENVLPNSTTGTQYLGVKIKLANDSKENVKLNWKNFKCNASGKWEFAMNAEKLGSTRKKWLEESWMLLTSATTARVRSPMITWALMQTSIVSAQPAPLWKLACCSRPLPRPRPAICTLPTALRSSSSLWTSDLTKRCR